MNAGMARSRQSRPRAIAGVANAPAGAKAPAAATLAAAATWPDFSDGNLGPDSTDDNLGPDSTDGNLAPHKGGAPHKGAAPHKGDANPNPKPNGAKLFPSSVRAASQRHRAPGPQGP